MMKYTEILNALRQGNIINTLFNMFIFIFEDNTVVEYHFDELPYYLKWLEQEHGHIVKVMPAKEYSNGVGYYMLISDIPQSEVIVFKTYEEAHKYYSDNACIFSLQYRRPDGFPVEMKNKYY